MRFSFLILFFLLTPNYLFSQNVWNSFWQLSGPEKYWVITHPFVAKKAHVLTQIAIRTGHELKKDTLLDGDDSGGQVDAFRHSYWMALLSQKISLRKIIALGKAHEKGNYKRFKKGKLDDELNLPDSISSLMDLFNNYIGVQIGLQNRQTNADILKIITRLAVIEGQMKVLSKNNKGEFLDCGESIIDMRLFLNVWNIPKCLVSSDSQRRK